MLKKLSVSQLVGFVKRTLGDSLPQVQVKGEVGQFTRSQAGHWYFTLKDDGAQIRAVMFRQHNLRVGFFPQTGDELEVTGALSVYEGRGDLQFICANLTKAGQGGLNEQYLRLKNSLQKEGLFESNRKQELPVYVFSVGVVTSAQAAAWADMQTAFSRRVPHVSVRLYPCAVQGSEAVVGLCKAIAQADKGNHDVLVIGRGGGSLEDLWCFNDEAVVRAVAACQTPTIVGVGHESDTTLSEFASDLRAATPTAAVELCSMRTNELLDQVEGLAAFIAQIIERRLNATAQRIDRAEFALVTPQAKLAAAAQRVQAHWEHLVRAIRHQAMQNEMQLKTLQTQHRRCARIAVENASQKVLQGTNNLRAVQARALGSEAKRLDYLAGLTEACSPQRNLEKGYSILSHSPGTGEKTGSNGLVRRISDVEPGQRVTAKVSDGTLELIVGK